MSLDRCIALTIVCFIAPLILRGCTSEKYLNKLNSNEVLNVSVREPVERDWQEIKGDGVLRMITRYSSSTYFLYQGLPYGFEYELLKRFAKNRGLALDVVIMKPGDNPYDLLNSGKGDIIAANYAVTDIRDKVVDFTRPYNIVSQIFVFSDSFKDIPETIEDVAARDIPVTVRANSSYYHRLLKLEEQGYSFKINLVSNNNEAILIGVSRGKYAATIADKNIFRSVNSYIDNLVKGPVIDKRDKIAWAIRENADRLKKELNQFLAKHFKYQEDQIKKSAFLNILRGQYFNKGSRLTHYYSRESSEVYSNLISPYNKLFKHIADSAGIDWLMLAAIAAQESHFNPNATGWAGAVGLMQVMPQYATVDKTKLYQPKVNIRESVRMLTDYLDFYSYIPPTDRWKFVLATYNAGYGHLADARTLALKFSRNPNNWKAVADALFKLMNRKFYKNAQYGFVRGVITVNYVQEIMNRYHTYQTVMALASASRLYH